MSMPSRACGRTAVWGGWVVALAPLLAGLANAGVAYVDARAPGGGDGTSWATAFNLLQTGLAEAQYGETISELRVAQGTYYPDRNGEIPGGSGNRYASFNLVNGVALRGGFAGLGAADPNAQDPVAYPTVLSGEIGTGSGSDNTLHVVSGMSCGSDTVLEGFVITGGQSVAVSSTNLDGAGVLLVQSSPRIVSCVILGNQAGAEEGFGAYLVGNGGGLACSGGSPVLQNCVIQNNRAGDGQNGFCTAGVANPGNRGGDGGGAYFSGGNPLLIDCTVAGNVAGRGGSGTPCAESESSGGDGGAGGGVFFSEGTSAILVNCVIRGNQTGAGGDAGSSAVSGGAAGSGAGFYSQGAVRLVNCTVMENTVGTAGWPDGFAGAGSAAYANVGSPECVNSVVWANGGGAGAPLAGAWAVSHSCVAGGYPGLDNIDADPLLTPEGRLAPGSPCIDAGDNAAYGAYPPYDRDGWARFMDDPATSDAGGSPTPVIDMGAFEFWTDCNGNGRPDYMDITGGYGSDCNGNGIPDDCDIASGTDPDCNANGYPDECDVYDGWSSDCNANGVPDECDIADLTSGDCNGNLVPDECDIAAGDAADCNANGIPDECDLADGASADCNDNGQPDECDIALGVSSDCDSNGVPDECDLLETIILLDLGDMAVGGNGLGSGLPGAGITPRTGALVPADAWGGSGTASAFVVTKGDNGAANLPYVDGVFVPNGQTVVSSTGMAFSFPPTTGRNWDAIRNAVAVYDNDAVPPHAWPLRLTDDPEQDRAGLGMHTNAGITFDLAAIRAAYPTRPVLAVVAMGGLSVEAAENPTAAVDAWVLVDGVLRWTQHFVGLQNTHAALVVPIGATDRFVTLATTDAGSMTADHAAFADAKVILARVRDCNHNGVLDECDIANGTSLDCNGNGVPDECDLASGASRDCNLNGIPDECDIAGGQSRDCNTNGVPDECDITSATSHDNDHNGVPDECQPDSDGDGVIDTLDGCPLNPLKTAPGACGCDAADTDTDGDGTPDCLDGCPLNPLKTAPGACGCDAADTDTDGDGVPDCVDNCPDVANANQADADGNGVGDACEIQEPNDPALIRAVIGAIAGGEPLSGRADPNDPTTLTTAEAQRLLSGLAACPLASTLLLGVTLAGVLCTRGRR